MREIYTFVGMSGVGKSHWSRQLSKLGFDVYSIDDLIAEKLASVVKSFEIKNDLNYRKSAVGDLAKWMGFADDERYIKKFQEVS
jgi:shikimate kinase